jgi:hypothetical protein
LRRYTPYAVAGAPWLTFQLPHVHRHNIPSLAQQAMTRQRDVATSIGLAYAPIQIGVPAPLFPPG